MLVFNGKTTDMIGNKLREEGDDMKQRFTANVDHNCVVGAFGFYKTQGVPNIKMAFKTHA